MGNSGCQSHCGLTPRFFTSHKEIIRRSLIKAWEQILPVFTLLMALKAGLPIDSRDGHFAGESAALAGLDL